MFVMGVKMSQEGTYKLKGPEELIREAWDIFRPRILKWVGIELVPIAMLLLSLVVIALPVVAFVFKLIGDLQSGNLFRGENYGLGLLLLLVFVLIGSVIQVWGRVAIVKAAMEKEAGIIEIYKKSWNKILRFWWVAVLSGLVMAGGLVLLIVPGIILAGWFSIVPYIVVAENVGGLEALVKAREYVRGLWWPVVGRLVVAWGALIVVTVVLERIFGILAGDNSTLQLIAALAQMVVSLLVGPLAVIYGYVVYRNVREVKGEIDVGAKIKERVVFTLLAIMPLIAIVVIIVVSAILGAFNYFNNADIQAPKLNESSLLAPTPSTSTVSDNPLVKSREVVRKASATEVYNALRRYYSLKGVYPVLLDDLVSVGELKQVPVDPLTQEGFSYQANPDRTSFELCVDFETQVDDCFTPEKAVR